MIYAVYVEDRLLDINPSQVIALTLQASDIGSGDLINRKASFTNQLTVPKTNNNISVLGYSNILNAITTFPFVKKSIRITANGITILQGVVIIKSFDNGFNLQIYSIAKDLAFAIGNKKLDELDFGDSPITWDAAYWEAHRASTSGICCPVVQYGQIDVNAFTVSASIGTYYLPSVSYKDILTQILTEAGYTISGTFYSSDDYFNRMVMTYGRKEWPGTSFKINEILPDDITQADFLKDFLIRFGAFFRFSESDIEIVTLEGILADTPNAVNWTEKRANKKQTIEYAWDRFGQENFFRYPTQDFVDGATDQSVTSDGMLTVDNENIDASQEIYTSIFAQHESPSGDFGSGVDRGLTGNLVYNYASVSRNILCATQRIWDDLPTSYEFDHEPKPMLCLLRDQMTFTGIGHEGPLLYNGNGYNDFKIATFAYNGSLSPELRNMRWQKNFTSDFGFLDLYYPTLQLIMTSGAKKVTREYVLNDLDIYSLDLLTPIFDTDDYFLISKVIDYVSGRITKVELLRIAYQS